MLFRRVVGVLAGVAALAAVIGAVCGDEQVVKLEHKIAGSREATQQLGLYGQSGTVLNAERPDESVAQWPRFLCAKPLYGYIYLNLPSKERPGQDEGQYLWLAVDQSGDIEDTYDILYIDLDRDGKFSKWERRIGRKTTNSQGEPIAGICFGAIAVPTGRAEHMVMHLWVTGDTQSDGNFVVWYTPLCYLEGIWETPSGTTKVRLFDQGPNGSFTDYGADSVSFKEGETEPLSRIVPLNGGFINFQIAPDVSCATITPYTGKVGKLSLNVRTKSGQPPAEVFCQATSGDISLPYTIAPGSEIVLPAGDYPQSQVSLACKDGDRTWSTYIWSWPLHIVGGKVTALALGSPMRIAIAADGVPAAGEKAEVIYTVKGAAGETYSSFYSYGNDVPWGSSEAKTAVKDAAGNVVGELTREPG
jgi:hypothetical protein